MLPLHFLILMPKVVNMVPYSTDGPFKQTLLFLLQLAWKNKVQLPVLITVAFMALDIRLQLEINIFWAEGGNGGNRRDVPQQVNVNIIEVEEVLDDNHDDGGDDESDGSSTIQEGGGGGYSSLEENDYNPGSAGEDQSFSNGEDSNEEKPSTIQNNPAFKSKLYEDLRDESSMIKYCRKSSQNDTNSNNDSKSLEKSLKNRLEFFNLLQKNRKDQKFQIFFTKPINNVILS